MALEGLRYYYLRTLECFPLPYNGQENFCNRKADDRDLTANHMRSIINQLFAITCVLIQHLPYQHYPWSLLKSPRMARPNLVPAHEPPPATPSASHPSLLYCQPIGTGCSRHSLRGGSVLYRNIHTVREQNCALKEKRK